MQILLIPFLIILTPVAALYFVLRYFGKTKKVSVLLKIALGLKFGGIGLVATYVSVVVSMTGIVDKGITCATGAVVFIPFGILVNLAGIPLMLILYKSSRDKDLQLKMS